MLKPVANPWVDISWSQLIAPCDKDYLLKEFGSLDDNSVNLPKTIELSFKAFPEPFSGDVNSKVYCLDMNPGKPDDGFNPLFERSDSARVFEQQVQLILSHKSTRHFYTGLLFNGKSIFDNLAKWEKQLDLVFSSRSALNSFKVINTRDNILPRPHAGAVWQREIWNPLRKLLGRDPHVFFVEFFPYHSAKGFKFPEHLPSYEYRNYLIRKAMLENKLIIIMRSEVLWYKAIPELEYYPNKLLLKTKQRVWLSLNNFCRDIPVFRSCSLCQTKKEILDMF